VRDAPVLTIGIRAYRTECQHLSTGKTFNATIFFGGSLAASIVSREVRKCSEINKMRGASDISRNKDISKKVLTMTMLTSIYGVKANGKVVSKNVFGV
jgi:hypothetical protein